MISPLIAEEIWFQCDLYLQFIYPIQFIFSPFFRYCDMSNTKLSAIAERGNILHLNGEKNYYDTSIINLSLFY